MGEPSFPLVAFGVVVALLMAIRPSLAWHRFVMLVASLFFLSTFGGRIAEFLPIAGFIVVGFVMLRTVERYPGRTYTFAICATLLIYLWLKRYTLVPASLWMRFDYVKVGMSYIMFRLLHLIIESRSDPRFRAIPAQVYLSYLIGFNTLVAGPIQLYDEYLEDEAAARPSLEEVGEGIERIVVGLFKTNVLAFALSLVHARSLGALPDGDRLQQIGTGALLFGLYPVFLYCNFSGYMDIVIGISRLMGRRLPENFDRPFASTSFIEFWTRWHITLSRWLRLYVYNPLLMSLMRRFPSRAIEPWLATLAFFVTFFLIGVWHGRTTAFLFFGVLQGGGVAANKAYQLIMIAKVGRKKYSSMSARPAYKLVARGLTYTWFAFTLTWFWASWDQAWNIWASAGIRRWAGAWLGIFVLSSLILGTWEAVRHRGLGLRARSALRLDPLRVRTVWITTLMAIVIGVVVLSKSRAPEIIYKNF